MEIWNTGNKKLKKPPFLYRGVCYQNQLNIWKNYFKYYYPTNNIFDLIWFYLWDMNIDKMGILLLYLGIKKETTFICYS